MRLTILGLLVSVCPALAADQLVHCEQFDDLGGWKLDTQFVVEMGSPYLLAHGLGRPVADATTTVELPAGEYTVFARTKDWVARWDAPGAPGKFQIVVDGKPLETTFGTEGAKWHWQNGGQITHNGGELSIALHDLTGFDGRCDAIYFSADGAAPTGDLHVDNDVEQHEGYDLVVVGGGYAGMGSALSAARMGCKVALIQDRHVLGGNGSSEVRVWSKGLIRRGRYPRIGEIIAEFADEATKSPGTYEEFGDALKEQVVRAEDKIDLFLNTRAIGVSTNEETKAIESVKAFNVRTGEHHEFFGELFADCTGHGWIGVWAGADHDYEETGRMGMSNMWAWSEHDETKSFPETPWALQLNMADFPYPRDHHGQWFWESGFDKDPLDGAEAIRDWNLRAVYGAFNAMKNGDGAADHQTATLDWVAFVGGPRESNRLLGDVVLNQDDIVNKQDFPDGCVPSTWSIDLHYPKKQYAEKYPDNPFISVAVHDRRVDRTYGYPVPYRCFYSRNIPNLFMAGRNVSVTHQALGTVRVMRTCGMMGEVVGRAASICIAEDCSPRGVYEEHLGDLLSLLELPGKARRETVTSEIVIPDDAMELASSTGPPTGLDPKKLEGLVIDNRQAVLSGSWKEGTGLPKYVGYEYLYAANNSGAFARFTAKPEKPGRYRVRVAYQHHENRGEAVPVEIRCGTFQKEYRVDMTIPPDVDKVMTTLDEIIVPEGEPVVVTVRTDNAKGNAHADAIQLVPVE